MWMISSQKLTSGLPGKVKIGPVEYRIEMATDPKGEIDGQEVPVYGMVNFRKTLITIADDLPLALTWQCFIHEILHILFEHMGLEEPSEGQIDNMAYLLLEFLLDNGFLERPYEFPALESAFRISDVNSDGR